LGRGRDRAVIWDSLSSKSERGIVIVIKIKGVIFGNGVIIGYVGNVIGVSVVSGKVRVVDSGEAITIRKEKTTLRTLTTGQSMDSINDIRGHREGGGMTTGKKATSGQAEKIVTALCIAGGAKRQRADGARSHGIVVRFMRLNVLPKRKPTVPVEIQKVARNNGAGTKSRGDAIGVRERIEPEHSAFRHFSD
jgi:hypothetical protein